MKKTLIALAVAVSAVSGAAHADFQGRFNIDGTITHEASESKWEWAIGSLDAIQKTTNDMTDKNTLLTIAQDKATAILSGHTKEAFSVASTGFGAVPVISFSDYKGGDVVLENLDGNPGKGYFSLPMKDSENNDLGSVKVNVTYAALLLQIRNGYTEASSLEALKDSHVYYGGLVKPSVERGNTANEIVQRFGGVGADALRGKIPNAPALSNGYKANTDMVKTDGSVMASSYTLGIDKGQTIEARFNKPVLTTTKWSAPLSVLVTYN
ncbi:TPA: fimbrial protein [Salmonella enterica subsp. enterica serovar Infantis]|nr:fimbrial protein [Salmonella enterica subsp. enterica serovar Infantis]